ncbi:MAG: hypothetical protein AAGI71_03130 [Bacteroidota bacterium]
MTIPELIAHAGDDTIMIQNLDESASSIRLSGGVGKITFNTAPSHVSERAIGEGQPSHIGLLLWLPAHLVPDVTT